jgi:hypothetical protein
MQRNDPFTDADERKSTVHENLDAERQQVIYATLQPLLASQYFRKSKRYPALLEYIVRHTLKGAVESLKERFIGAEVFGRPIDYDTNSDPCVRVAAGEVRRRMALYYSENIDVPVRIELPLGSYVAEFHFANLPKENEEQEESGNRIETPKKETSLEHETTTYIRRLTPMKFWRLSGNKVAVSSAVLLIIAALAATTFYFEHTAYRMRYSFWAPMMQETKVSPLIVVAQSPSTTSVTRPLDDVADSSGQSSPHGTLDINIAAADICSVFGKFNRRCEIIPAHSATLQDFRDRSVVLVGNLDSTWTVRLMAPLRYRLASAPQPEQSLTHDAHIVDSYRKEDSIYWKADTQDSSNGIRHDYAIITRFHSDTTGSSIVIFAGLDNLSTSTVAILSATPGKLGHIVKMAPKGWGGDNFEAVVQIDVLRGYPESSKVVATYFW